MDLTTPPRPFVFWNVGGGRPSDKDPASRPWRRDRNIWSL